MTKWRTDEPPHDTRVLVLMPVKYSSTLDDSPIRFGRKISPPYSEWRIEGGNNDWPIKYWLPLPKVPKEYWNDSE